ncbi:MAG: hypothetical protein CVU21_24285 [Betaproteobacteria bacterium HGW-Betaproteobacteria-15]|uniref:hypothetical protein n=1 Tax=Hydrogenophaga sp. TaxID=1904254 RepID=UPI000CCB0A97|nr:hypothetical protein [Hydrogenophaga sp.]MDO9029444.1 hypothetical protein [Hydrogenophaga sp.]PKO74273.1 MAG: hypothetical protein CVU21_24285 [Betaproteobacteria bacterium HGW-Betaproteobacteria-15]
MVDEAAYRRTQAEVNRLPCVFKAALLARQAVCELAVRHSVAEREVLACGLAPAHLNCETLERLFVERATFPLKLPPGAPLTHGTVMRLHCGGLRGLQQVLDAPQPDVHRMVMQAQVKHGSLVQLPWEHIVAQIVAWQPRRRANKPVSG